MTLNLTAEQTRRLLDYLNGDADCEQLSQSEYVADFYDAEQPATVNFLVAEDGEIEVAAAAWLLYDEAEDGWYMGQRIEDAGVLTQLLSGAGAI